MKKHALFLFALLISAALHMGFIGWGMPDDTMGLYLLPVLLGVFFYRNTGLLFSAAASLLYFGIQHRFAPDSHSASAMIQAGLLLLTAVLEELLHRRYRKRCEDPDAFFNINMDMACSFDPEARFLKVNRAFEQVLGYQKGELERKSIFNFIHPKDRNAAVQAFDGLKQEQEVLGFTFRFRCKDGTYKYIEWRAYPRSKVIFATARDVTDSKLIERLRENALKRYEALLSISGFHTGSEQELLSLILSVAIKLTESRDGFIFYCDPQTKTFSLAACSRKKQLTEKVSLDAESSRLLWQIIQNKNCVVINNSEHIDLNIFCVDQGSRTENLLLAPVFDEDSIVAVAGVKNKANDYEEPDRLQLLMLMRSSWELVRRRRAEMESVQEKMWLETTLLSIGDGVAATDRNGVIRIVNSRAAQLTNLGKPAVGNNVRDVFQFYRKTDDSKTAVSVDHLHFLNGTADLGKDFCFVSQTGENIDLEISAFEMKLSEEEKEGYVIIFRDVTQKNRDEKQIIYLTYHDKLTGLYNRRFFEEELQRLDQERNLPISVIMGDVNGLKLANDAFGHLAGDNLLIAAARVMKEVCRADDIVARWGGDEYIILLPRTDADQAAQISDRIRQGCSRMYVSNINLSISLGCATKTSSAEEMMDILKSADDVMYKSKLLESRSIKSSAVKSILKTLCEKNISEEQHSERVSALCKKTGLAMAMTQTQITDLELLGKIHDIGKISVDESILNKPASLTPEEYEKIKRHSETGYHILSASPELSYLAEDVLAHHERWDGKGYPNGTQGNQIPVFSRILSVADAFDAMISKRPYRPGRAVNEALKELQRCSGSQFDPEVTAAFLRLFQEQETGG